MVVNLQLISITLTMTVMMMKMTMIVVKTAAAQVVEALPTALVSPPSAMVT